MALQRYDSYDDRLKPMIPDVDGDYLLYDDVMALLEDISNCDTDMPPKEAVLRSVLKSKLDE